MQLFGIDISEFQGDFDFYKAKEEGIKFAMVRAGYTDRDNGISKSIDSRFEENYRHAKENGIPIGAYWYSRATNYERGKEEAIFMYEYCLKGKSFEYPIAIDVEDNIYQRKAGKKELTEAIKGFMEYLEDKGYYVIIYASDYWFRRYIETNELDKYDKWVASWSNTRPTYPKNGMWQFSGGKGKPIADVECDRDYAYKNYPQIMLDKGLNGFKHYDEYYPKTSYQGNSFIDGLKSINVDSSFTKRTLIAHANNIDDYRGTSKQNTYLLDLLKIGKLKKDS